MAIGLLPTIKTEELKNKTDLDFPTSSPLTSPKFPACTQAPCLKLKTAAINTRSSVTSVHTKCHCSGFWLQLSVPGAWEAIFRWWQNPFAKAQDSTTIIHTPECFPPVFSSCTPCQWPTNMRTMLKITLYLKCFISSLGDTQSWALPLPGEEIISYIITDVSPGILKLQLLWVKVQLWSEKRPDKNGTFLLSKSVGYIAIPSVLVTEVSLYCSQFG